MRARPFRVLLLVALGLCVILFLAIGTQQGQDEAPRQRSQVVDPNVQAPIESKEGSNKNPTSDKKAEDQGINQRVTVKFINSKGETPTVAQQPQEALLGSDARLQHIMEQKTLDNVTWQQSDRVVVMGRMETYDVRWVARELPDWQHAIYTIAPEDPTAHPLHTAVNKGREAMAYLTYIIDHYEQLPSIMAFIHPHSRGYPEAWHTDAPSHSISRALKALSLTYVNMTGYTNLRCLPDPGCDGPNRVHVGAPRADRSPEIYMATAWSEIFSDAGRGNEGEIPEVISIQCCAQFAVARWQVQARPRAAYEHYRDWLLRTDLADDDSGRVFEFLWHVIFGKNAQGCLWVTHIQCRCALYGVLCPPAPGEEFRGFSREDIAWATT